MSVRIALIVEGATEKALLPALRNYLARTLSGRMPKLHAVPQDGRLPKEARLLKLIHGLLRDHEYVIALTDVYTGHADFRNGADARDKMRRWVGPEERFYPHAAQYEFEAWLLPYWETISRLSGCGDKPPGASPEDINHQNPPSSLLREMYRRGGKRAYSKTRDGQKILETADLSVAIRACSELRLLVETIERCCSDPTPAPR